MSHRSMILAGLVSGLLLHSASAEEVGKYRYYYYDQPQPLALDVAKVAVFEHEGSTATTSRNALTKVGIVAADIQRSQVPRLVTAGTPADARNDASVNALVKSLADDNGLAFASPVFKDSRGLPLMLMDHLHVGFKKDVDPTVAESILAKEGAGRIEERNWGNMPGVYRLLSPTRDGFKLLDIANRLAQRPEVLFAEPDWLMTGVMENVIPNDPDFPSQWGINNTGQSGGTVDIDMNGPEAWDLTQGSPDVITVVLDTGCQQDHPDINQIPGNDFTGQGTAGGPGNICDNHGTTVAGTIAAIINNSVDTAGIAPQSVIASARMFISNIPCDGTGAVASSWVINALTWAETIGARVTNMSTGMPATSALNAKFTSSRINGIIHFAAAGNSGASSISYPGSYSSVEAISAINRNGFRAGFSQFGNGLAFSAPGVSIVTADRTGTDGYTSGDTVQADGTSYASPYSAGVAALLYSYDHTLWPPSVRQLMADTAKDLGNPGYETGYGYGLVDAYHALLAATGPVQRCTVDELEDAGAVSGDLLADSVAATADFALLGVSGNDDLASNAGAAEFYQWDGANFTYLETVHGSDSALNDGFGSAAAMDGDLSVIGAPKHNASAGAVYVFRYDGANWAQEQKLTASDAVGGDFFGDAVSVSGDVIVVGARTRDCADLTINCGAAYVYRYNGSTWSEEDILTASDAGTGDLFGASVSVNGDLIAVGATAADCPGIINCGVGYVYRYDGANWNEEDTLLALDPAVSDSLGGAIAIEGDRVLVGAVGDDCPDGLTDCGAVYDFEQSAGVWSQSEKISSLFAVEGSKFGSSIAMKGNFAVIGAPGAKCGVGLTDCGTAFAYQFDGSNWEMNTKFIPPTSSDGDQFGAAVGFSGRAAVIGAAFHDCTAGGNCGKAYVFGATGDCNGNGVDDFCDIRDGFSLDVDDNGEPDECICIFADPAVADMIGGDVSIKNRYLSFSAGNVGEMQAIRVTVDSLPAPFNALNGTQMWVDAPTQVSEFPGLSNSTPPTSTMATLVCDPVYRDWSGDGIIHVFHEIIIPGGDYTIQVIGDTCDITQAGQFSDPLEMSTSVWGDVVRDCSTDPCSAPDGVVSVPTDIVSILDKFSGLPGAPIKARADIEPATPDHIISVQDTSRALSAFQGFPFPFAVPANPCP